MFKLTYKHLLDLCAANEFPIDANADMVFFGLRGCLPADTQDWTFRDQQTLTLSDVDYTRPRCTIGQIRPQSGTFAVYAGSTVPHRGHVERARRRGGQGANQLLTGFYEDYRKGKHRQDSPSGHEAFRQSMARPVQRTSDDLDYDGDDEVEIENPGDNLHAAFCASPDVPGFASAGCQVVVGFPKCAKLDNRDATGPWRGFHAAAYQSPQSSFGYFLVNGREAFRMASVGPAGGARVRFGSRGPTARRVQEALAARGFYEGAADGNFGARSVRALLAFQRKTFGPRGVDGVFGPQTAATLGIATSP